MDKLYTRVNLIIEVKDYPVGGIVKMHFWLNYILDVEDVDKFIKDNIEFNQDFKNKYTINKVSVGGIHYCSSMSNKEGFGNLIFDSYIRHTPIFNKDNKNENNTEYKKKKNITLDDIDLFNIDNEELKNYIKKINNELFKREYFLSDDEFNFYDKSNGSIDIKDVKNIYKKYNGDLIKYKKDIIRNKLKCLTI
ncbi:hypothetical protein [Trichloromonas sp.]|uniref:hypothetical protein n=1 Tax=Trichloromonas sp. TaxID=3069249 RepID=UPI002A44F76E|nr:hypothetical protein [Trichloromonas sp.]